MAEKCDTLFKCSTRKALTYAVRVETFDHAQGKRS